jgi:hypothetical protein
VKTDVFDVQINPLGGDVRRVTMRQHHSAKDQAKALHLLEPDPNHFFRHPVGAAR